MSRSSDVSVLWEPISIGALEVRNRVFVSAHLTGFNDEDVIGDRYIDYYEERARGGVGFLITGAEGVHYTGWHRPHFQAWREDAAPRYRRLADAVHAHGAKIFTQLWHTGLQDFGTVPLEGQHPVFGPSAVPSPVYRRIAKAMEREDIEMVVDAFGRAAELAQAAGIDGVEIAGAHGYLISNFLSKLNNRREDEYGGSVANRCRFAIEVGREVRRRVGADFPISFRMVFEEYVGEGGFQPEESAELLGELHRAGLFDMFNISGGTYHSQWATSPLATAAVGTPFVEHSALAMRVIGGDVPVGVAGGIAAIDRAAEIVTAGEADLIAMTRAHMADPELVNKARESRGGEVRRCVGANQGCIRRQLNGGPSGCTVNPAVGREGRYGETKIGRTESPLRLLVVGGGPGGLKLAETAARRGHQVTLVEREGELGGQVRSAGKLPNRGRWLHFVEDLSGSLERLGVDVQLGTEASLESVRDADADVVTLATGSYFDKTGFSVLRPDRQGIPGAGEGRVLDPIEAVDDPERSGAQIVIVDDFGDHASLGVAHLLANAGKKVSIVTTDLFVGRVASETFEVPFIYYPQLLAVGVELIPSSTVERITEQGVEIVDVYTRATRKIPADTVILNMLRKSEDGLYNALRAEGVSVKRIGDCVAPRQIDEAVYEGMTLGLELEQAALTIPAHA
jgi:2,4-dienoyl-CoA reductase-like NADH-dependent reductase (Old Yellow Enzyme family)/thioredoxin reductase